MDRTTRYLFILLGVVVFFILAPLIVLYISGTRFNLDSRDTTATGILVAKSVPDNAKVFINDEEKDKTPATIRFLDQGEYQVKITKQGFLPWTKRLSVEPSKVTYTYEGLEAVELLREPIPQLVKTNSVTTFVIIDDVIWYASGNAVYFASIDKPEQATKIDLSFTPTSLAQMRDSSFLLAQNANGKKVLLHRSNRTTFPLPDSLNDAKDLNITTNNFLVARRGDQVYSYNLTTRVLTPLLQKIAGFTLLGNTGYIAQRADKTTLQTVDWNGNTFTNPQPLFNNEVPGTGECQLVITDSKELFVFTGENFYRANAPLELISSHVKSITYDQATDELTFTTPSELWFYNFVSSKPQLLTRTTVNAHAYLLRSSIGYGFIGTPTGLEALEIDSRDQQNRYQLLSGEAVWAIGLSDNEKTAVALQNGQLLLLPIR